MTQTTNKIESRAYGRELRIFTDDTGNKTLTGYFAVYNSLSEDLGGFVEQIAPGAFDQSLKDQPDVLALYHHDYRDVLGRTTSGTLTLQTDDKGLRFALKLPNTTVGNDVAVLVERGDIHGCSFGFYVPDNGDTWGTTADGTPLRTLLKVVLIEGTITPVPAYPDTSVAVRSARARGVDFACLCQCGQCKSGHCEICSAPDCRWLGCRCGNRNKETPVSEKRVKLDDIIDHIKKALDPDGDGDIDLPTATKQEDPDGDGQKRSINEPTDDEKKYIQNRPGHKNSTGEDAPWVILQKDTGDIIASFTTKDEAYDHFKKMLAAKYADRSLRLRTKVATHRAQPVSNDNGCECPCDACVDDDCPNCSDPDCDDPDCID